MELRAHERHRRPDAAQRVARASEVLWSSEARHARLVLRHIRPVARASEVLWSSEIGH